MKLPGPSNRRVFLVRSLKVLGAGALARNAVLDAVLTPRSARAAGPARTLVLVRLYGGNDGLNTIVPYGSGLYYDGRPTIAIPGGQVLPIDGSIGFHPALAPLKAHYDAGRLAVLQSVHYPNPDLSHFTSEAIWMTADPTRAETKGWIGRYLDTLAPPGDPDVRAVDVSYSLDQVFYGDHPNVFALPTLDGLEFPYDYYHSGEAPLVRDAFETISLEPRAPGSTAESLATGGYVLSRNVDLYAAIPDATTAAFPDSGLGRALREVARMATAASAGDIATGVYQVGIGGFDTHARQERGDSRHSDLLADLAGSLAAFQQEITARGLAGDTVVVLYSEFGRRVEENGSFGTDHGTSAPMLVLGAPVAGGVYGPDPDLADLDADDNLKFAVDFRQVYATLLARWLGADPVQVLGGTFTEIPFLP